MPEGRGFKQNFIRSFIIGAVISSVAYMVITGVPWGILGLELGGGPKPDAAVEEAARTAAVTETVIIGGKTWMKRNLNVWTRNSWCYDDNQDNCNEYGRLYTWHAAKRACASLGDGWRLATKYDWDALIEAAGGRETAAAKLRAQTGWPPFESGDWPNRTVKIPVCTDDFGFSALPGGDRYGETHWRRGGIPRSYGVDYFHSISRCGVWWTATEDTDGKAYCKRICYTIQDELYLPYKTDGFSVRCVKY